MKRIKKEKLLKWTGLLPAVVLLACVGFSLNGYTAPVYELSSQELQTEGREEAFGEEQAAKEEESSVKLISEQAAENGRFLDGVYTGSGQGYGGKLEVAVTVKEGKITELSILNHQDGSEFIQKASTLLNRILDQQSISVDTVSGATYSSVGILQAVRDALKDAVTDGQTLEAVQTAPEKGTNGEGKVPTVKTVKESGKYQDGTYYGSGNGFGGALQVKLVIKNGKIHSLKLVSSKDDASFMNKAKSLLSKIVSKQSSNVDIVSGATYSSAGLIQATRNALKKAEVENKDKKTASESDKKTDKTGVKGTFPYKDGTYTGKAKGFRDGIVVQVTLKDHKISKIKLVEHQDDKNFFERAAALLDRILVKQNTDVDVVAGATKSSEGLINAVKEALKKAAEATDGSGKKTTTEASTKEEDGTTEAKPATEAASETKPTKTDSQPTEAATESKDTSEESTESSEAATKTQEPEKEYVYKDGTYTGKAYCREFAYNISLEVKIEKDEIISISNVQMSPSDADNLSYLQDAVNGWKRYTGVVPQILKKQSIASIDAVSGATFSSETIVKAVDNALKKAKK